MILSNSPSIVGNILIKPHLPCSNMITHSGCLADCQGAGGRNGTVCAGVYPPGYRQGEQLFIPRCISSVWSVPSVSVNLDDADVDEKDKTSSLDPLPPTSLVGFLVGFFKSLKRLNSHISDSI